MAQIASGTSGGGAGWLARAASPIFAIMAVVAATSSQPMAMHGATPGGLPIDGMSVMYVLMSLFHLPVWLKSAGRGRSICKGES